MTQSSEEGTRTELQGESWTTHGYGGTPGQKGIPTVGSLCLCDEVSEPEMRVGSVKTPEDLPSP